MLLIQITIRIYKDSFTLRSPPNLNYGHPIGVTFMMTMNEFFDSIDVGYQYLA